MSKRRTWLVAALLVAALVAIAILEPGRYLNLDFLKAQQAALQHAVTAHPLQSSLVCFAIYAIATALSVPGAIIMTLAAGAVFGTAWGTLIVSFASTVGATLAFLLSRYLFRDFVQSRFGHRLAAVNRGMRNDGPTYLLVLRLIPVVPFVAVNLLMGLTPIGVGTFYLYSQIGMLPATAIYVNAGTQLASIDSLRDIASPEVLGSLALLAVFPFVAKFLAGWLRRRRLHAAWPPPRAVERNVIVIGAGSAGLVASVIAAAVKARVTLVEGQRMGGDCLNTGCVPSKALLRVAKQVHQARRAEALGIRRMEVEFDFADVMRRVHEVIAAIAPHDSVERFTELGVECVAGHARIVSPYEVEVEGKRLSARSIVLATGARPLVPPLPGLADLPYLTSDNLWSLERLPRRLLVLGGGPIGCELAQAFARLGSQVTVVEMAERLLPREDVEVSELLAHVFAEEGIELALHCKALAFHADAEGYSLEVESLALGDGATHRIAFDDVLVALGRVANVEGYGLEELGVALTPRGTLDVNDYLQTRFPNVFACGDVVGPYQFTHAASHQAWYATVNALFGSSLKRFAVDYRVIPWCTFTDPEVARVGLSEQEARERGVAIEVTNYALDDLDRAIADGTTRGFVRVLTPPGSDRILGATIVGEHAGDLIAEFVLAMKHGLGLNKILGTIHIYPTLAEASKFAAGNWRKRHVSPTMMAWLERFHRWRREG
ncbi:MAG: FAD-dependent oxidoreductase [Gammaproteobacteria bacterium]|nr:FAD-dependent oxidoreductase [Gammaproteobacteria bacterium]MCP5202091.1 FAD-dependent oxidoreductase [Gammaproteobacteria bacterium]